MLNIEGVMEYEKCTSGKSNMEPKNGSLEDDFSFQSGENLRFHVSGV